MTPLTPLTFDILLALADEDRHGYGIIKEIEDRSRADAAPSTGAMYLALKRMQGEGLLELSDRVDPADARRRYYRLTEMGRIHAELESRRLESLVVAARSKRLLTEGAG
ncbi:MAG: PadR family transcriptional regulator [Gemmatimonadota bacterium]